MKIALRVLSLLILVVVTTFYAGCKKDDGDEETVEKKQLDKLLGDWTIQSASDGQDRTSDFFTDDTNAPLVLHIQGNYVEGGTYNYSFTGQRPDPSPWPVDGTWKFGTDKNTQIIRDPGGTNEIPMDYQVTATDLILTFTVPDGSAGWEGGTSRVNNVIGEWTFTFKK
jgi:hypothetical protein